jgi:hypothetical protein
MLMEMESRLASAVTSTAKAAKEMPEKKKSGAHTLRNQ